MKTTVCERPLQTKTDIARLITNPDLIRTKLPLPIQQLLRQCRFRWTALKLFLASPSYKPAAMKGFVIDINSYKKYVSHVNGPPICD
jgi:hypothetical protein